jgi:fructose-1,6-bisphosphatase/inositol monophosphatase family enzyme
MTVDIDTVTRILAEAAAEEILPRFRALERHEIREKDSGELVTVADVAAEELIARRLEDLLPGSYVVAEEAVAASPELLAHLDDQELVWIIDPIDGTGNFARGQPVFAVMVALLNKGQSVAGWIHDPVTGRTATAEHGEGAWLAGGRLAVAPPATREEMRGTLHAGTFSTPEMGRHVQARRGAVGAIRSLRCAGHEYLRLAAGQTHYALFTKLMPWDHVPGTLILREAGGIARTLDGRLYEAKIIKANGLLNASDPTTWQNVYDGLFGDGPLPWAL